MYGQLERRHDQMPKNNQNSSGNSSGNNNRNKTKTPPKTGQTNGALTGREEFSRELTEIINKATQSGQSQTAQKRKNNK